MNRINELVQMLNDASVAYYTDNSHTISDRQYDKLYDELIALEKESGTILSNSPTQKVGSVVVDFLPKVKHNKPMLSLDKTKEITELKKWLGKEDGLLSWKKDGLTVVLTYENGTLVTAVTRGDGETGEDITHNAKVFANLPLTISYKEHLEIRGEAVISYKEFETINDIRIANGEEPFKTPRNLASGSTRQLDNSVAKERHVMFFAFQLINSDSNSFFLKTTGLDWLETLGFQTDDAFIVDATNIEETVAGLHAENCEYPVDGLVLTYNSIPYSDSLGHTSRFPLHSMAFKWADDVHETIYSHTECEIGRTGIATPTAIYKTVDIDGTGVSRASCHNVDYWEDLKLGKGDKITVYKANMIIPQIDDNLTRSGTDRLPTHCSFCDSEFVIYQPKKARFLKCPNEDCPSRFLNKLAYFVSRDCMNISGLSKETLEKLVDMNIITDFSDIYRVEEHKNTIINMEGFGVSSYNKLIKGINNSRQVKLPALISALGIKLVGLSTAKLIVKAFNGNIEEIFSPTYNNLININGIGAETAMAFENYFTDANNREVFKKLWKELTIITAQQVETGSQKLSEMIFVVTGDVSRFKNRKELQAKIEEFGGTVSGSVSSKTSYVIANEISNSSKCASAQRLGIKIISELDFITMIGY